MKSIKLKYVDVNLDSIQNLLNLLQSKFEIDIQTSQPEYILHSCFGKEVLKYKGVRILWLGENLHPDFNISDYAMGFSRMQFGDRYRRVPLYRWYFPEYESLFDENRKIKKKDGLLILKQKSKFCTAVVSNGNRDNIFESVFTSLNEYKSIDSGGKWRNNMGGRVKDKLAFLSVGKFTLAFENTSSPGYVTEKILHAFASNTIPIYWGAPDIALDFNPKAFVNVNDYSSIESLLDKIKQLDTDDNAYCTMVQEPCFVNGIEPPELSKNEIINWFKTLFDQPVEKAYRRNLIGSGLYYEQELYRAYFNPLLHTLRRIKLYWLNLSRKK